MAAYKNIQKLQDFLLDCLNFLHMQAGNNTEQIFFDQPFDATYFEVEKSALITVACGNQNTDKCLHVNVPLA